MRFCRLVRNVVKLCETCNLNNYVQLICIMCHKHYTTHTHVNENVPQYDLLVFASVCRAKARLLAVVCAAATSDLSADKLTIY